MGASAILKSVDFRAFAVNVKTIALGKDLYQFGHAIYWGDMPMAVYTFLEKYDWNGKTIHPFCTHEGSGLSGTEGKIQNTCKGAAVTKGLAIQGGTADRAKTAVEKWV